MEFYGNDDHYRFIRIYLLLIAALVTLMLVSCTITKYVPVETVKTEYRNRTDSFVMRDSIYCRDSVWVERKGDTITLQMTKFIYKDRWREKIVSDTVIRRDSIQVPVPVERRLSRWEQICLDYGKVMTGVALVGVVLSVLAVLRWIRRRKI